MSNRKRKSMLYYLSVRYFLILLVSITILGAFTVYVIYKNSLANQEKGLERMARDIGTIAADHGGAIPSRPDMARFLDDLASSHGLNNKPIMFILDRDGDITQQFPPHPPDEASQIFTRLSEIMNGETHVIQLNSQAGRMPFLVGVYPIVIESSVTGYALYMVARIDVLGDIFAFRMPRLILVSAFLIIGWGIVYSLIRRLVKPIQEAANAAKQIAAGNYDVDLTKEYREQEIHELMVSFKEMADRLNRLGSLRSQLLAGVTHELKTPVTSISGLVQAVRERVVKGEEADVFLDYCMKECNRLQNMVEDLLDFNSFAAGSIAVTYDLVDLKEVLTEIIARWQYGQEHIAIEFFAEPIGDASCWQVITDPTRMEQIIINLLNNARDAMTYDGMVIVRLTTEPTQFRIHVQDAGRGIPLDEQIDVFEPFYRGNEKKAFVRGLGLGLPFSRLIARSLGGDLVLTESSPNGTTFSLLIPSTNLMGVRLKLHKVE